ncbi:HalOD1 output domain-containing protein [Natronococcus wangiae]|uniref:HalOD1 output domain-containing protein n=1 Tax=Natronococcus wangiae TaxID=3068275 RepID=UPI00273FB33C|nr:HalOD1 output domain-containing protein [Natronococcus sp. AD5]
MRSTQSTNVSPDAQESFTYQSTPDTPLSEAVISAVAAVEGVDQLELADEHEPLYDAIDPTALDSLFRSSGSTDRSVGAVAFEYAGYRITVDQTGQVTLAA